MDYQFSFNKRMLIVLLLAELLLLAGCFALGILAAHVMEEPSPAVTTAKKEVKGG